MAKYADNDLDVPSKATRTLEADQICPNWDKRLGESFSRH